MKILFWGVGNMGLRIANRLAEAKHAVYAWDISDENYRQLNERIKRCVSKNEGNDMDYDVVISMLPDDDACRDLAYNTGHIKRDVVWVNLSTVSLALNKELFELATRHGGKYVSSPVMGRMDMAEKGLLDVYYGGDIETLNYLEDLYHAFCKKIWFCGESLNSGIVCKLAGNFLLNSAIESIAEAVSLVVKNNVSEELFSEIMLSDTFNCPAYSLYFDLITNRKFTPPGFRIKLGLKDINLICAAAESSLVTMPIANLVKERLIESIALGDEDLDESALSSCNFNHSGLSR